MSKNRIADNKLSNNVDRLLERQTETARENQIVLYNDVPQADLKGRALVEGLAPEYHAEALSFTEAMRLDQTPPARAELEPPSLQFVLYAFGDPTQRRINLEKVARGQKSKTNQLLQKINQKTSGNSSTQQKLIGQLEKEPRMLNLVDHLLEIQDGILARMSSRSKG
jgi:hypothetical protein